MQRACGSIERPGAKPIAIQNQKVLLIFIQQFAHNQIAPTRYAQAVNSVVLVICWGHVNDMN